MIQYNVRLHAMIKMGCVPKILRGCLAEIRLLSSCCSRTFVRKLLVWGNVSARLVDGNDCPPVIVVHWCLSWLGDTLWNFVNDNCLPGRFIRVQCVHRAIVSTEYCVGPRQCQCSLSGRGRKAATNIAVWIGVECTKRYKAYDLGYVAV
jgi:hypothetical protein